MGKDLEKRKEYDKKRRNSIKLQKAEKEAEEEEKRKKLREYQKAYHRAYRQMKKREKMAANENSVPNGAFITPKRNGGVTSVVPGNNEVSYENINLLKSRFADSSNAKKSSIASLKEVFFAMKDTADKAHDVVDKANNKEDEKDDLIAQLITGNIQNRFEETETRPDDMDMDIDIDLPPHQGQPEATPNSKPPPVPLFGSCASTSTNVPAYAKLTSSTGPPAGAPFGAAPTNGGWTFRANASTSTNAFDNVKLAPSTARAPTNGGWTFRANASTSTNVPAYAKPSTAPAPWAFPPAGAPPNGGFSFSGRK
jgi:hypothetical protein